MKKTLKFKLHLAEQIRRGTKVSTWRLFDEKNLQIDDVIELCENGVDTPFARATITKVVEKTLGSLTDADWVGHERFANEAAMYRTYREYYGPTVGPDTVVKILWFELVKLDIPDQIQAIIEHYNTPSSTHIIEELKTGLNNNYVLEGEGIKYFLKQYRHTDHGKVKEIHSVKKHFAENGIPVIQPITTKEGGTLVELDSVMYALFPFIDGFHQEEGNVSDVALDSLAQNLANIHRVSITNPLQINDIFKDWDRAGFAEKAETIIRAIDAKDALTELEEQMRQGVLIKRELVLGNTKTLTDFTLPSTTLCHGDYHVYNIFFDANQKVEWVFDWEKAEMAPRVFELIRSMDFMNLGGTFDAFHLQKAKMYVNAYHGYYPLAEGEFARGVEMRFIKSFHSLWIEGEVFLKDNNRFNRFYPSEYRTLLYLKDNLSDFIHQLAPA